MTTPVSYGLGSARWQYISDGYRKYWYLRSALRWLSGVAAVTALIVFGIVYHTWADYKNVHTMYFGPILFVAAPLLSFVTSVTALVFLFLLRKKIFINPGWLLSADLINSILLSLNLCFNAQYTPGGYSYDLSDGLEVLQVPWCFCIILGFFHLILFLCEIWEVHFHRRMIREQRQDEQQNNDIPKYVPPGSKSGSAEPEDIELQLTSSAVQDMHEVPDTPLHTEVPDNALVEMPDTLRVEMPGTLRVELPDGRILELPEGCRVELPADHRAEHRAELADNRRLRIITQPYELDSTSTASTQWYGSSPVAPSYKTQEW